MNERERFEKWWYGIYPNRKADGLVKDAWMEANKSHESLRKELYSLAELWKGEIFAEDLQSILDKEAQ